MTQPLSPDAILLQTNLVGALSAITDDPDAPDSTWLTATSSTAASILRVSFPAPTGSLVGGAGLQQFRVWVRKTNFSGTPTTTIELWESGVLVSTLLAATNITSTTGQLLSANWDSTGRVPANIELRLTGTVGGSGGNRATMEVGAVEWVATTGIWSVTIAESFGTSDAATLTTSPDRDGTDALTPADDVDTVLARARAAVDSLSLADLATNPVLSVELWENGVFKASLGQFNAFDGVISVTWNASLLAQLSGAGVELRLVPLYGSVDIGAVEWNARRAYVDDAARQQHVATRTASDTVIRSDSLAGGVALRSGNDTLSSADTNTQRRNVLARADADTVTRTESAVRDADPKRTSADALAAADAVARSLAEARPSTDTTQTVDSTARGTAPKRTAAETEATSETATRSEAEVRTAAEATTEVDAATRLVTRPRTASDSLTTVDALGGGIQFATTSDTRVTVESPARSYHAGRTISETLALTESLTTVTRTFSRAVVDVVAEAESLLRATAQARAPPDTRVTSEVLTDTTAPKRTTADTRSSAEAVIHAAFRPRSIADSLTLAESVLRDYDPRRDPTDTRSTAEVLAPILARFRSSTDLWTTGANQLERLAPNTIVAASHLLGPVTAIDDDPDAPDAEWLITDGTAGEVRVAFTTPAAAPVAGAALQEFRVRVRLV